MATAAVLGAGSWGTALAIQLSRNGHKIKAWDCDQELIASLKSERCNSRYLPDYPFPDSLSAEQDLATAIKDADFLLAVVPSYAMRIVCEQTGQVSHNATVSASLADSLFVSVCGATSSRARVFSRFERR